jgi:hypothetical protein
MHRHVIFWDRRFNRSIRSTDLGGHLSNSSLRSFGHLDNELDHLDWTPSIRPENPTTLNLQVPLTMLWYNHQNYNGLTGSCPLHLYIRIAKNSLHILLNIFLLLLLQEELNFIISFRQSSYLPEISS